MISLKNKIVINAAPIIANAVPLAPVTGTNQKSEEHADNNSHINNKLFLFPES